MKRQIYHPTINQREVTLMHAREIHKAMGGDEEAQKKIKLNEISGLQFRHGFHNFLEVNRDVLVIFESAGR